MPELININPTGFSIMSSDLEEPQQLSAHPSNVVMERKNSKMSLKKNSSGSEQRAPLGSIDPNKKSQSSSSTFGGSDLKKKFQVKRTVKKQRINRKESAISSSSSLLLNNIKVTCEIKLSSSEDSFLNYKEEEDEEVSSKPEEYDEELLGSQHRITYAKPVIDPNDSLEYENELKMLEEFYQAKSHDSSVVAMAMHCTLHGQPFIEEEEEEEVDEDEACFNDNDVNNNGDDEFSDKSHQVLYRSETDEVAATTADTCYCDERKELSNTATLSEPGL